MACVKYWRRKHIGKLTLGPSKLGKPRANRGPARTRASKSRRQRREAVGNETSGSRRKYQAVVGNVGKPSKTSGSRWKRRETIGNVRKMLGSRWQRREAAGKPSNNFQKPRNASMSENAVGKQISESRPRSVSARKYNHHIIFIYF